MFHEGVQSGPSEDNQDGYVTRTIAFVNCCPPFRYNPQTELQGSVCSGSLRVSNVEDPMRTEHCSCSSEFSDHFTDYLGLFLLQFSSF